MATELLDNQFEPKRNFNNTDLTEIRTVRNELHKLVGYIRSARMVCFIITVLCLIVTGIGYSMLGDANQHEVGTGMMVSSIIAAVIYFSLGILVKKKPKIALTTTLILYSTFILLTWIGSGFTIIAAILQLLLAFFLFQGTKAAFALPKKLEQLLELGVPNDWAEKARTLQDIPTTKTL